MGLSATSKREIAVRAAEAWLRQGYTIASVDDDGVTLRRTMTVRSLAVGTLALLLRGRRGSVVLKVDDDGQVSTIQR